jgi:hypothetical protein
VQAALFRQHAEAAARPNGSHNRHQRHGGRRRTGERDGDGARAERQHDGGRQQSRRANGLPSISAQ